MIFAVLFAAALAFTSEDAGFAYRTAERFVSNCTPRDAGTIRGGIAANWILDSASIVGANVRRDVFTADTPKGPRRFVNLYGEFENDPSARWVILVSHYDTKPGKNCPGANDGASTTGLLIAFARALAEWKTPKGNVMLVWTDGEESQGSSYGPNDGFQGSKRAVEYLRSKKREVQAVLCLDMLGDKDLHISIPTNGTEKLAKIAVLAARRIGEPKLVSRSPDSVRDDHLAFLAAGYPAIDLIDFEYGPGNAWWHTREDTIENISIDSLEKSGRLVAELLNILL